MKEKNSEVHVVQLTKFEALSDKIKKTIQKHEAVKKDKEKIEAHLAEKRKENQEFKKQLERTNKERDYIKQRLDGIISKIEALDSM
jgi:septal ring factor EnvC (AmiA/AmiB activator)